jgi:hypothetical protein
MNKGLESHYLFVSSRVIDGVVRGAAGQVHPLMMSIPAA